MFWFFSYKNSQQMTRRIEAQQVTRERFYEIEQKVATRLLPTEFADIRTTLKSGDMIQTRREGPSWNESRISSTCAVRGMPSGSGGRSHPTLFGTIKVVIVYLFAHMS
jgi:hypothetical protein